MSQPSNPHSHDPSKRQRSEALNALLARCPEHLFSTDESKMALRAAAPETSETETETATLEKAA